MLDIHYNDISERIFLVFYITEQVKFMHINNLKIITFSEIIKISLTSIQHKTCKNLIALKYFNDINWSFFSLFFFIIYIFRETWFYNWYLCIYLYKICVNNFYKNNKPVLCMSLWNSSNIIYIHAIFRMNISSYYYVHKS